MKYFIAFLILALPLACSSGSDKSEVLNNVSYSETLDLETVVAPDENFRVSNEQTQQKLIKESYLSFETEDLDQTYKEVNSAVKKHNGYIQDDSANKSYNRITRRITVRVPTSNFQNIIEDISDNVAFFDTKRISSKAVTEEYVDLEARLKAKRTLEKRYLELLDKAKNVKEVLEVERELSSIREEIEAKQGRLNYLQNRVSLSTINIEFYKLTAESKVTNSYGSKMWNALISGFDGLSIFFLGILHIWPLILIIIIAYFLIKNWISKRNKK